tara:strand:+ start:654 stop:1250 length:597 start_codon:yes stop_codon:yes gene_type:complete
MKTKVRIFLAAVFVDGVGVGVLLPIVPVTSLSLGDAAFVIVGLVSAFPMSALVGTLVGRENAWHGKVFPLFVCSATLVAGVLALMTNSIFSMLFAVRCLAGFVAGSSSISHFLLTSSTTDEARLSFLWRVGASIILGIFFGSVIVLLLTLVPFDEQIMENRVFPVYLTLYDASFGVAAILSGFTAALVVRLTTSAQFS